MSKGIIYIATGEKFVEEAEVSAESVKEHMPDVNIAIMTDIEPESDLFDKVIELDDVRHDFGDQVFNMDKTPYEKTIFLDSDIYLEDSIYELFEILDEFDIGVAQNKTNFASKRTGSSDRLEEVPWSFPEYNSGVVSFRNSKSFEEMMEKWKQIYREFEGEGLIHNQASFRYALYKTDVRIATIPREYNCLFRKPGCVTGKVKAFHGRILDIDGPGAQKSLEIEEAIRKINSKEKTRAYYSVGNRIELAQPSNLEKLKNSIIEDGFTTTTKKIYSKFFKNKN